MSDLRAPPDYGRIAWPEDIVSGVSASIGRFKRLTNAQFGSLEVDGTGNFVDGTGNWQSSGTYRVVTREGILGLTDFMRGKMVERLREEEAKMKTKS